MPERIDDLTRGDIREMFETYARTNDLTKLRALATTDPRFRAPVFHAMLRQEHLNLRTRTDLEELVREGILRKFARAELIRAREFRDQADPGPLADLTDRMLLASESREAMAEGAAGIATAKLERLVALDADVWNAPLPRTGAEWQRVLNALDVLNSLAVACEHDGRFDDGSR